MIARDLRKGHRLADGATVESDSPVDHGTYVSVVTRYANGETRIRSFDVDHDVRLAPRAASFARPSSYDAHVDIRASNRYERQLGL